MGLISCESKALWESSKNRRTTQALSYQDSLLMLQTTQPAFRKRNPKQKTPIPEKPKLAGKAPSPPRLPLLQRLRKIPNPEKEEEKPRLGGKRARDTEAQDDEEFRKRRRLHEQQLRDRRLQEVKKVREFDESKNRERGAMREAARKALEKEEIKARENVVDHYKVFKDLAVLLMGVPNHTFPYFYP